LLDYKAIMKNKKGRERRDVGRERERERERGERVSEVGRDE
jgi:hypothetical protein